MVYEEYNGDRNRDHVRERERERLNYREREGGILGFGPGPDGVLDLGRTEALYNFGPPPAIVPAALVAG